MKQVLQLLDNSRYGICFTGIAPQVQQPMQQLLQERNACRKLLSLLGILHQLSATDEYIMLDKQHVYPALSAAEKERINEAMGYIVENFQSNISLTACGSACTHDTGCILQIF